MFNFVSVLLLIIILVGNARSFSKKEKRKEEVGNACKKINTKLAKLY